MMEGGVVMLVGRGDVLDVVEDGVAVEDFFFFRFRKEIRFLSVVVILSVLLFSSFWRVEVVSLLSWLEVEDVKFRPDGELKKRFILSELQ